MKEISFTQLCDLIKKGLAPNRIEYKFIKYDYQLKDLSKEERIKDIEKYGMWNNGGYVGYDMSGNVQFLLDNLSESNFKAKILVLNDKQDNSVNKLVQIRNDLDKVIYDLTKEAK